MPIVSTAPPLMEFATFTVTYPDPDNFGKADAYSQLVSIILQNNKYLEMVKDEKCAQYAKHNVGTLQKIAKRYKLSTTNLKQSSLAPNKKVTNNSSSSKKPQSGSGSGTPSSSGPLSRPPSSSGPQSSGSDDRSFSSSGPDDRPPSPPPMRENYYYMVERYTEDEDIVLTDLYNPATAEDNTETEVEILSTPDPEMSFSFQDNTSVMPLALAAEKRKKTHKPNWGWALSPFALFAFLMLIVCIVYAIWHKVSASRKQTNKPRKGN